MNSYHVGDTLKDEAVRKIILFLDYRIKLCCHENEYSSLGEGSVKRVCSYFPDYAENKPHQWRAVTGIRRIPGPLVRYRRTKPSTPSAIQEDVSFNDESHGALESFIS